MTMNWLSRKMRRLPTGGLSKWRFSSIQRRKFKGLGTDMGIRLLAPIVSRKQWGATAGRLGHMNSRKPLTLLTVSCLAVGIGGLAGCASLSAHLPWRHKAPPPPEVSTALTV